MAAAASFTLTSDPTQNSMGQNWPTGYTARVGVKFLDSTGQMTLPPTGVSLALPATPNLSFNGGTPGAAATVVLASDGSMAFNVSSTVAAGYAVLPVSTPTLTGPTPPGATFQFVTAGVLPVAAGNPVSVTRLTGGRHGITSYYTTPSVTVPTTSASLFSFDTADFDRALVTITNTGPNPLTDLSLWVSPTDQGPAAPKVLGADFANISAGSTVAVVNEFLRSSTFTPNALAAGATALMLLGMDGVYGRLEIHAASTLGTSLAVNIRARLAAVAE